MIKYTRDAALEARVRDIAMKLYPKHDLSRIACVRSSGSKARRTLARCHALPRVMQLALGVRAHYVIEVIEENFGPLSDEEKIKTIIHELMHIPQGMKGGFRYHDFVCSRNIRKMYEQYRTTSSHQPLVNA